MLLQQGRQPRATSGSGVATHAGIDDPVLATQLTHSLFEQGDPAAASAQTVFGAERIANDEHPGPLRLCGWTFGLTPGEAHHTQSSDQHEASALR
jgi:hypothetical protein